jgi:hypothetical protein
LQRDVRGQIETHEIGDSSGVTSRATQVADEDKWGRSSCIEPSSELEQLVAEAACEADASDGHRLSSGQQLLKHRLRRKGYRREYESELRATARRRPWDVTEGGSSPWN